MSDHYERPEDNPEVRASLHEDGLLSPVIEDWRQTYIVQHGAWFDIAKAVNKLATKLYVGHWPDMEGQKITGLQPTAHRVFGRALNNFAGAVTLAERGFSIEAASLARSISEASVWLGYMVEEPDKALSDLDADDLISFISRHKELRRTSTDKKTIEYSYAEDVKLKAQLGDRKKPDWTKIAQKYGTSSSYMKFRILSGFYSHLSGASLQHYIQSTGGKGGVNMLGPHSDQIPHAMYFACDAMTDCGAALCVIFDDGPLAVRFHTASKQISMLRDAMSPKS